MLSLLFSQCYCETEIIIKTCGEQIRLAAASCHITTNGEPANIIAAVAQFPILNSQK